MITIHNKSSLINNKNNNMNSITIKNNNNNNPANSNFPTSNNFLLNKCFLTHSQNLNNNTLLKIKISESNLISVLKNHP